MRSVAIRPGARQFTVTPSAATSDAKVLAQPTRPDRSAFDNARLGIGWITPEDTTSRILPNFRARIPGSASLVSRIPRATARAPPPPTPQHTQTPPPKTHTKKVFFFVAGAAKGGAPPVLNT